MVARKDKTLSRIQNMSHNPKTLPGPGSKTLPRIQNTSKNLKKYFPEYKNTFKNRKHIPKTKKHPRIQNTSQNPKHNFRFWNVFWILGSFLDSGKCSFPMSNGSRYLTLQKLG